MTVSASRNYIAAALCVTMVTLTTSACSPFGGNSPEARKALEIANTLHSNPIDGMTNLELIGPDCGIDYCNNDSSFSAKPKEGPLDATHCEAIYSWVTKNLSDVEVLVSYNRTDTKHGIYGCKSVLPTMFYAAIQYAGFYDGTLVQVYSQSDRVTIQIDSEGITSLDELFGVDPKVEVTGQLLNQFAAYRESQGIKQFSEKNVQEIVDTFRANPTFTSLKGKVSWKADNSGKVREIHLDYGNQGLLPFCISIEPWDTDRFGVDPGPDYMMIFQDEGEPLDQFGFAFSGDCSNA